MYDRHASLAIEAALADTRVVLVAGPRQSGKSTLVQQILSPEHYRTLDDAAVYAAASADPQGFVNALPFPAAIDEIQRLPELFLPIKAVVDRDQRPGHFLLTGSANVFVLPRLADSLAGRMEIVPLWPLSQGEIEGVREEFVDAVFDPAFSGPSAASAENRTTLVARALRGGYPEVVARPSPGRRRAWFESYIDTLLQRDLRGIQAVEGLADLPRLLGVLAGRSPGLLNTADVSRTVGIPVTTLRRYLALLEALYIIRTVPPWTGAVARRLVRAPRLLFNDPGLLGHLLQLDRSRLALDPTAAGPLLETFVHGELMKQTGWSDSRPSVLFFRTQSGQEVDFVIERRSGEVVGIEVKASATVTSADFRGLRTLSEEAGPRFIRGILLYTGTYTVPFGDGMWAVPMDALWRTGAAGR